MSRRRRKGKRNLTHKTPEVLRKIPPSNSPLLPTGSLVQVPDVHLSRSTTRSHASFLSWLADVVVERAMSPKNNRHGDLNRLDRFAAAGKSRVVSGSIRNKYVS